MHGAVQPRTDMSTADPFARVGCCGFYSDAAVQGRTPVCDDALQ